MNLNFTPGEMRQDSCAGSTAICVSPPVVPPIAALQEHTGCAEPEFPLAAFNEAIINVASDWHHLGWNKGSCTFPALASFHQDPAIISP